MTEQNHRITRYQRDIDALKGRIRDYDMQIDDIELRRDQAKSQIKHFESQIEKLKKHDKEK